MRNTICATGGRVHIEPVEGGDSVRLEITTESGAMVSIMVDESSGGAIIFALENSLELVAIRKTRAKPVPGRFVHPSEQFAVRSIRP